MSKVLIYKESALDILDDFQSDIENCVPHAYATARQRMSGLYPRNPDWIPCSEMLPEEKDVVAVIIKQWDTGEIKKGITYRVDRNMWVGFGRHNEACVWWLPLPPWKGADDESVNFK